MKIQYILASAALLIAVLLASTAISAPINTNVTNATMEIELSKSSFSINETITGILRIPLNQNMDAEQEIELRIQLPMKRVSKEKTLASALTNASFNFTQSDPSKVVSNPTASKTLSFSDGGEKSVAIQANPYSTIQSIDMTMSGPDANTLDNVRIDVGNDGEIEWYYLGTKTGTWASEFTKPEGISESPGPSILIRDNNSMYCQVIDLPFAKDFEVSAQYQTKNSAGNITAAIIDIGDEDNPSSLTTNVLECDLPENADMSWGKCEINGAEYGLHGNYLVCVYSTNGTSTEIYELKTAAPPSTTAHTCYRAGDRTGECEEMRNQNPQIKIKQATYTKTFKGDIDFTAWDYWPNAVNDTIGYMIGDEAPQGVCDESFCTIELRFIANKSGIISLSNLNFEYLSEGAPLRVTNFYDVESSSAYISSITKGTSSISLPANATIEIPLEVFGLKAPQTVAGASIGTIEARFAGKRVNASIAIGGAGIPINPSTAPGMIEETRTALNALNALTGDAQLALKILGKDKDITAAISELGNLSARASADTPALRAEITSFREKLPKEVILGSSIKDFQIIEPDDITTDIAPEDNKESTYSMQEKAQVKASVTTVSIKDFAGATAKYALVKKEITAKSQIAQFDIYEVIDKSVADSTSDIVFETTPTAIVKDDPIVKWFVSGGLATGAKTEQRYMVKSEFDVAMEKVKTIIVPSGEAIEEPVAEPDSVCGDGICTDILEDATICPEDCTSKTPWNIIIPIIIVALLLGLYLGFYKGKYSLWNLTKKKKPFTSNSDLESVKSFIRNSRDKDMDDSVTKSRLHEKGWTEEQIKFAFGEMEWEKKEKSVEKPSENTSPIREYIKTALSRGMSKEKIQSNLIAKGWKEEDVKKELEKK